MPLIKRFTLMSMVFCLPYLAHGQDREAAIWNFGQLAGLDFNSLAPVSYDLGRVNTIEGTSSISDEEGNLLFYTDGVTVHNGQHQVMPNGTDLLGGNFSTQSALIVPRPGNENYFYLFTVSDILVTNSVLSEGYGLNYYTVNLASGLGSVNSLSTHLVTYDTSTRQRRLLKCSQKLTAIKDPCDEIYWVITHFEDSFYAFRVTDAGIDEPVISSTGPYMHLGAHVVNSKGQLKMSPDGTKLAMANFQNSVDSGGHSPGSLYLFDFDINTGVVSNSRQMMDDDFVFAYGVEFSPNSRVLYATVSSFKNGNVPPSGHENFGSMLVQVDLENDYQYRKLHDFPGDPDALQLAIDGKIYVAQNNRRVMGAIHQPNTVGRAADFDSNALSIGRSSTRGLPAFVQSYFQVRVEYEDACEGEPTQIMTNYLPEPDNIDWDFGDGTQLLNTLEKNPVHVYPNSGNYVVTATITKDGVTEQYSKIVEVRTLPAVRPVELTQCENDGDGFSIFNLNEAGAIINPDPDLIHRFFYTEEDARNEENEILGITYFFPNERASQVFVRVENEFGCHRITTVDLVVESTAIPSNFMLNYQACDDIVADNSNETYTDGIGTFDFSEAATQILALFPDERDLTVSFYANEEDALAEIREIDASNYRNEKSPHQQDIWVRVDGSDSNSCIGLGHHVTLQVNDVPDFDLQQESSICQSQYPYVLSPTASSGNYDYAWFDEEGHLLGESERQSVTADGTYTLVAYATNGTECSFERSIALTSIKPPVITDVEVKGLISFQASVTVILESLEGYEFALDNMIGPYQRSNILTEVAPGIHDVYVRDVNGCELVSQQFSVIGYPPFFTPNNDGANDYWQIQGISENIQPNSLVYIYDRFGNFISKVDPASQGWDGMMEGQLLPSSDYWFRVTLDDGREFSGHFALMR